MAQCQKCFYHTFIITVELDKKTKKRWNITRCSNCEYPTDIEPYAMATKKTAPKLLRPPLYNDKSFIEPDDD